MNKAELAKEKVLVVDDSSLSRLAITALLQQAGRYEICAETDDARVARRLSQELRPGLILLELEAEERLVPGLLRDFAKLHRRARTLVISNREDAGSLQTAMQAGARGYVAKRDAASELLAGLQSLSGGGFFASSRVAHLLLAQVAGGLALAAGDPVKLLSAREREIFERLGRGGSVPVIAGELGIQMKTVESYLERIKEKLGLESMKAVREQSARRRSEN
jgi:DNA-binding NarL/FixJ family response regulator